MSVSDRSLHSAGNIRSLPNAFSPSPKIVYTDVDDTLTCDGRLPVETFTALYNLQQAGFTVIPVTGASAGWCDCMIKTWPVNHVIGENGALTMEKDEQGIVSTSFVKELERVHRDLADLKKIADELANRFPAIGYTQDQPYRLTDIAFDIGQTVTVRDSVAIQATNWLVDQGVQARRSSIHINAWIGNHSKATGAMSWLSQRNMNANDCLFIGDSPNDESMFEQFPLSVGVANIERFLAAMKYVPTYLTKNRGGYGFADMANVLLRGR